MKTQPSDYTKHPFNSVLQNSESETVAHNTMKILARTGDTFRPLAWSEYKHERLKDKDSGDVDVERGYFRDVIKYCLSAEAAATFADGWK